MGLVVVLTIATLPAATQDAVAQVVDGLIVEGQVLFEAAGTDDSTSADNGAFHGIQYAQVQVWDACNGCSNSVLDHECTDQDGAFQSDILDNSDEWDTRDIYIATLSPCSTGVNLGDEFGAKWTWDTLDDHRDSDTCKDGVNWDLPDGVFDIGECAGPADQDEWWTIKDYAEAGITLAFAEDFDPGNVKLQVPETSHDGAEYHPDTDTIHIPDETYVNGPDVATHEVGHFIMDKVYAGDRPPGDCPSPHFFDQETNQGCAWREGWADFYAVQAFVGADRWRDDSGVYDSVIFDQNIETESLSNTGPDVGGAVAGTLWDLVDNDNDDTNGDGAEEDVDDWSWSDVFAVFQSSAPVDTFTEFRDAWVNAGNSRRDFYRAACDNHIPEWDDGSPSGSVDAPSESLDGSYTVTWTSSDDECGVSEVDLEEETGGTWSTVCTGGASGSCSRSQEESGTYCYRARIWDGAGGHQALSAKDCTEVLLGGGDGDGDDGGGDDPDTT